MQTTIETVGSLERRMRVAVPLADIDREVGERLQKLARSERMPGFRPGKVPLTLISKRYGPQVRGEVISEAVQKGFADAVQGGNLRVAGYPRIERHEGGSAEQLEFNATFEIYPELKLGDLTAATISRQTLTVGDTEVDKTIESLRKQRTTWVVADRAAVAGDRVTIDFVGKIDGIEFQGGNAKDFPFVLGEKRMLPEFEANVTGLATGGTRSFPLRFPDDYHGKDVAGKEATFDVTLSKVEAPVLPEVDADFAKSLGVADGDLAKMRAEVRENVEREVKQRLDTAHKNQVMQALHDSTPVDVPKALVGIEMDLMVENARADLRSRGLKDADKVPIDPEMFREQSTRRVTLGLVVSEAIKQHDLSAKPEQVKRLVEEYARSYERPFEVVKWVYSQQERLAEFEGLAVEDNVVKWVLSQARVEDTPVSFDELMGRPA